MAPPPPPPVVVPVGAVASVSVSQSAAAIHQRRSRRHSNTLALPLPGRRLNQSAPKSVHFFLLLLDSLLWSTVFVCLLSVHSSPGRKFYNCPRRYKTRAQRVRRQAGDDDDNNNNNEAKFQPYPWRRMTRFPPAQYEILIAMKL